jgi:hypothetical protein
MGREVNHTILLEVAGDDRRLSELVTEHDVLHPPW